MTPKTPTKTHVNIQVRYTECDPMNIAHHSAYPVWLEIARTQWLRDLAMPYADLQQQGILFVVARLSLRYRRPANYDDNLNVSVWIPATDRPSSIKVIHEYEVHRNDELLATASSTLVCVDRSGSPRQIPDALIIDA